jgi:hypothetical protein
MKNTMGDLRNHLFETLEALKDTDKPMEIDRALAVAEVADKIIETAKVEVAFIKVTGSSGEGSFVELRDLVVEKKLQLAQRTA